MTRGPWVAEAVFWLGLLVFVSVQAVFVGVPLWSRSLPPEVDDAYVYMVKSAELSGCFLQDCPALQDLRAQLVPSSDPEIAWQRYRAYGRAFLVYHPLYSVIHLSLVKLGISWELAYKLIWMLGPPLFAGVFGWWLRALWGPPVAGVALAALAFRPLPEHGLHYVVPANLALAVAVFVWTRLILHAGHAPWSLAIGTLLMVALHPVGRIYGLMACALAVLFAGLPRGVRRWLPLAVALGVVAAAFLLPMIVRRPELRIIAEPYPPGETPLTVLKTSLWSAIPGIGGSAPFVSGPIAVVVVALGYLAAPPARRTIVAKTALVLAAGLALSFLYLAPRYPADLFFRMWVPMAVLLAGAIGSAGVAAIQWSARRLVDAWRGSRDGLRGASTAEATPSATTIAALAVIALVATAAALVVVRGDRAIRKEMTYMTRTQGGIELDPAQPALLMSLAKPGERVLYLDETPMLFYFTRGAMQLRASYTIAIVGTPEEAEWIDRPDLRFGVTWNPVQRFRPSWEGMIPASSVESVRVDIPSPGNLAGLRVLVDNRGGDGRVKVALLTDTGEAIAGAAAEASVPARRSAWVTLGLERASAGRAARLVFEGDTSRIFVAGIGLGDDSLRWPWSAKARLMLMPFERATPPTILTFDPEALMPARVRRQRVEVLDDRGSTVLVRIQR